MLAVLYENIGRGPTIMICLGAILLCGFAVTRVSKRLRLPYVSGYIIAGVIIGPHLLGLVPQGMVDGMDFVADIALAFIAFSAGRYFKLETLKKSGAGILVITLMESLLAGALVTLMLRLVFGAEWAFALLVGAIATATAPASTLMTIRQYKARGRFVDTLLQVVALDDVIALLAFGATAAALQASYGGTASAAGVVLPIVYNIAGIGIGFAAGALLKRMICCEGRSRDNRLILTVATLLIVSGVCSIMDISPLLACMVIGAVYVNASGDEALFSEVDSFTPPVLSCFFVLSGMRLELGMLSSAGIIGVAYFAVRIVGKYLGAWGGCKLVGEDDKTARWLGVALIPQAGVSIGLAMLGQRLLPDEAGALLSTIILSSSVLYELIGPVCAKLAIFRSGAVRDAEQAEAPPVGKTGNG